VTYNFLIIGKWFQGKKIICRSTRYCNIGRGEDKDYGFKVIMTIERRTGYREEIMTVERDSWGKRKEIMAVERGSWG
jgi:hypothetical protein